MPVLMLIQNNSFPVLQNCFSGKEEKGNFLTRERNSFCTVLALNKGVFAIIFAFISQDRAVEALTDLNPGKITAKQCWRPWVGAGGNHRLRALLLALGNFSRISMDLIIITQNF